MRVDVLNIQGESTGRQIELPEAYFGVEPNTHAVYLAVKQYNAAQRQGTHKSKEKWEIAKSTKKLKRQKGTGTARAGSAKSPVFRGGGRVFGPKPHDYYIDVNKKVKSLAKASVLTDKVQKGMLKVVEDFQFEKPSTKEFTKFLENLQVSGKSLVVVETENPNVYLSGRNVEKTGVATIKDVNTFQILNADVLIISENSVKKLQQVQA
ncbi:MAG: 50S ribosomal protein L4 [Saprospiraceae bacterium]